MSHTTLEEWKAWVMKNHALMQHPADYEARFVLEVLSCVPEITPAILHPQYEFVDRQNKIRRIDFVVLDESRGLGLAIELDGLSKLKEKDTRYTNYAKFDDLLARQNDLLSSTKGKIFMLFRFSNKRWLNLPQKIAKQISEELRQELKAYQEILKHNRFAQEAERALAERTAERNSLLKSIQILKQKLTQEKKNASTSPNVSQEEKEHLLQKLAEKENALARSSALQEQANTDLGETQKKLEQERRNRMLEQQQRAEADALRDKNIAELKKRMDEIQPKQKNINTENSSKTRNSIYPIILYIVLFAGIFGGLTIWGMSQQINALLKTNNKADSVATVPPKEDCLILTPETAADYIGKTATVCGTLAEINSLEDMTFLNFEKPFPHNIFTCGIYDIHAIQFMGINQRIGQKICVTGKLKKYGDKTGIKLTKRSQLED